VGRSDSFADSHEFHDVRFARSHASYWRRGIAVDGRRFGECLLRQVSPVLSALIIKSTDDGCSVEWKDWSSFAREWPSAWKTDRSSDYPKGIYFNPIAYSQAEVVDLLGKGTANCSRVNSEEYRG